MTSYGRAGRTGRGRGYLRGKEGPRGALPALPLGPRYFRSFRRPEYATCGTAERVGDIRVDARSAAIGGGLG